MSRMRKNILNFIDELGYNSGCHQMVERSFHIKGRKLPICARCTGVLIGQVTSLFMGLIFKPLSASSSFVMFVSMGVDWGMQEIGLKESTNRRRFLTGILGGYGLCNLYFIALLKILKKK